MPFRDLRPARPRLGRRWKPALVHVARWLRSRLRLDPELRAMAPDRKVWRGAAAASSTERRVDAILAGYSSRPAIGERAYTVARDPATGRTYRQHEARFRTTSYGEVRARVRAVAAAWQSVADLRVDRGERVAIIGFAGADFAVLDLACLFARAVSVPLQSTTSARDIDLILSRTEPSAVAASIGGLVAAAERAVRQPSVRSLIAFDYDPAVDAERASFEAAREILERAGSPIRLASIEEVVTVGRAEAFAFLPPDPGGAERLAVIIHSSGSTGSPKGAMLSEATVAQSWNAARYRAPQITLLVVPLSHSMGRSLLTQQLRKGSLTHMTLKPDMTTLLEDVRLVRPTSLTLFPRVLDLICKRFDDEVARRARAGAPEAEARAATTKEMRRSFLGDRLRLVTVGSAPTSERVRRFLVECFHVKLVEVYSSTETGLGAVTVDGRVDRSVVLDFRLRDVPELGYRTTDTPHPRGELCFKAKHQIAGYFGEPATSADLLTDDGFIISGDIVELRGPDEIVIVDRRRDVVKLSQGEYVAVGRLATDFENGSRVIRHIYLHGDPHRSYLVAVVVPDPEVIAAELGDDAGDDRVKDLVHTELRRVGDMTNLKPFEIPRDVIIEREPFSPENGLLTGLHKPRRSALRRRYGERLEALYTDAAPARARPPDHRNGDPTIDERVADLVATHLGLEPVELGSGLAYAALGGDSLGAVEVSMDIEAAFGVVVPADRILGPTGTVELIAAEIASLVADQQDRSTFERIHGRGATTLHRAQLTLDAFLDAATLSAVGHLPLADETPCAVLVTGATGFLGREVCLQWMERLAPVGGRVVCLVRARDDLAARARLTDAFAAASDAYLSRFESLAGDHLEVVAGDIGRIRLGLDEPTFDRLATGIDRISHVAALVNHRLGYPHLFHPNVAGTAEVIRLAMSRRRKPIDFVSTVAVLPFLDSSTGDDETALPRSSVPMTTDRYAHGYAVSKWAAEHLLGGAATLGIPVTILRGPMMLPHRRTPGVINTDDVFTRLVYSVIVTGLAPRSFYRRALPFSPTPPGLDALSVDVVAAAVVAAAHLPRDGCLAVNLSPTRDGGSLDDVTGWIETAGYPVERVADHAEWLDRFRTALDALPPAQKGASALEVLAPYSSPLARKVGRDVATRRFRQLLGSTPHGTLPAIDEAYIHKCIADLRHLGLIPEPR